jgi:Flp pilus assembly protein CpaB
MKKIQNALRLLIALALVSSAVQAGEPRPALALRDAIEIAEKAKALRENSDKVFITSIALERLSILSGKQVWVAKWSGPLPANNPRDHEIGVQISMDGTVKHIVKGPADKPGTP